MDFEIEVKQLGQVYIARAKNESGEEICRAVAFSARKARESLKTKLGLSFKKKKDKPIRPSQSLYDSGSVMGRLRGVTSSRNWRKTK